MRAGREMARLRDLVSPMDMSSRSGHTAPETAGRGPPVTMMSSQMAAKGAGRGGKETTRAPLPAGACPGRAGVHAGSHRSRVTGRCGAAPPAVSASHPPGYQIVTSGSVNALPSTLDAGGSATCPAGTVVWGGGVSFVDGQGRLHPHRQHIGTGERWLVRHGQQHRHGNRSVRGRRDLRQQADGIRDLYRVGR